MTIEQAKSELMQIYGALSPDKQRAIDTLVKIEPCEDEYIKVPKKALKYRTAGMVAYNAEWLKNHFDIERVAICGAQEPCEDVISLKAVIEWLKAKDIIKISSQEETARKELKALPSVNPQEPKTGHWIEDDMTYCGVDLTNYKCDKCGEIGGSWRKGLKPDKLPKYCMNCGARMESEV